MGISSQLACSREPGCELVQGAYLSGRYRFV